MIEIINIIVQYVYIPRCFVNTNKPVHKPCYITFNNPNLDERTMIETISQAFPVSNNWIMLYMLKDKRYQKQTSFLLFMPMADFYIRTRHGLLCDPFEYSLIDMIEKLVFFITYEVIYVNSLQIWKQEEKSSSTFISRFWKEREDYTRQQDNACILGSAKCQCEECENDCHLHCKAKNCIFKTHNRVPECKCVRDISHGFNSVN